MRFATKKKFLVPDTMTLYKSNLREVVNGGDMDKAGGEIPP